MKFVDRYEQLASTRSDSDSIELTVSVVPGTESAQLLGNVSMSTKTGEVDFDNLLIFSKPGSQQTLRVHADPPTNAPVTIIVSIVGCNFGEVIVETGIENIQMCELCLASDKKYSYDPKNTSCDHCPENAMCVSPQCPDLGFDDVTCTEAQTTATVVLPAAGYWKSVEFSAQIMACNREEACYAQERNLLKVATGAYVVTPQFSNLYCAEGHAGVKCGSCDSGWAISDVSRCERCPRNYWNFIGWAMLQVVVSAVPLLLTITLTLVMTASVGLVGDDPNDPVFSATASGLRPPSVSESGEGGGSSAQAHPLNKSAAADPDPFTAPLTIPILKILTLYLNSILVIASINPLPDMAAKFFPSQGTVGLGAGFKFFSIIYDCIYPNWMNTSWFDTRLQKLLMMDLFFPLAIIFTPALFWKVYYVLDVRRSYSLHKKMTRLRREEGTASAERYNRVKRNAVDVLLEYDRVDRITQWRANRADNHADIAILGALTQQLGLEENDDAERERYAPVSAIEKTTMRRGISLLENSNAFIPKQQFDLFLRGKPPEEDNTSDDNDKISVGRGGLGEGAGRRPRQRSFSKMSDMMESDVDSRVSEEEARFEEGGEEVEWQPPKNEFVRRYINSVLVLYYFAYPLLARSFLYTLACESADTRNPKDPYYEDGSATERYLQLDTKVECYTGEHYVLVWILCAPIGFVVLAVLPWYFAHFLTKNSEDLRNATFFSLYGFLYADYDLANYYWETLMFMRKILVQTVSIMFNNDFELQSFFLFGTIIFNLIMNVIFEPYNDKLPILDLYSMFELVTIGLSLYVVNFYHYWASMSSELKDTTAILIAILNYTFAFTGLWMILKDLMRQFKAMIDKNHNGQLQRAEVVWYFGRYSFLAAYIAGAIHDLLHPADTAGSWWRTLCCSPCAMFNGFRNRFRSGGGDYYDDNDDRAPYKVMSNAQIVSGGFVGTELNVGPLGKFYEEPVLRPPDPAVVPDYEGPSLRNTVEGPFMREGSDEESIPDVIALNDRNGAEGGGLSDLETDESIPDMAQATNNYANGDMSEDHNAGMRSGGVNYFTHRSGHANTTDVTITIPGENVGSSEDEDDRKMEEDAVRYSNSVYNMKTRRADYVLAAVDRGNAKRVAEQEERARKQKEKQTADRGVGAQKTAPSKTTSRGSTVYTTQSLGADDSEGSDSDETSAS
jgi:hypothetical protein